MTTPANPDGSGTPAQHGWGEPPRYGQYAPGYGADEPAAPQSAPSPQYGQGQYGQGQYGQGQYGQPQYGRQPGGQPQNGGQPGNGQQHAVFTLPTDKPGIIPLRPLSLGEIYDGAFQAVRHNPGVVIGFTTLVLTIASVIGAVISLPLTSIFADLWGDLADVAANDPSSSPEDLATLQGMTGLIPGLYGSMFGTLFTYVLAAPLAQGGVAVAVSESAIGRKLTLAEAWRRVGPRWLFLVGLGLLQGLATLLVLAALVALVVGMFAIDTGVGVLGVVLAMIGWIVFVAWFTTKLLLIAPALVLERQGFWATAGRGWQLTKGVFWRTLGIYLLTNFILYFLSQIISAPVGFLMGFVMITADPILMQITYVLTMLVSTLLTTIFLGAVVALLYIDTRMRREGLDVQLAAAAADR
ncbi:hypothetical protein [Myceligenerans crystallogenes]|uniref:Membrane protein n=1 Tax=Myceligenerans crystallogenes TaxID=316335 RepID=A0ABN2NFK3_9MICO